MPPVQIVFIYYLRNEQKGQSPSLVIQWNGMENMTFELKKKTGIQGSSNRNCPVCLNAVSPTIWIFNQKEIISTCIKHLTRHFSNSNK